VGDAAGYSGQTLSVLAALSSTPSGWRHGYDIAKETGLKSGTLYPILIRLADRGLLESCWEAEQPAGRPRRHLYRLSAQGLVAAQAALAASRRPTWMPEARRRRLAAEGSNCG
jgi:DNA-binding PadR family transcriptional regulator